ncbi:hypothetical protein Kuura_061 [Caulobacter phage Kuura]|nr:hypothetical protein Kuura_001 [Caulobacter phage Kuura]WCD44139.1 hypothetical protein Kuura_061 [Caulobacter phage Kuura]
MTKAPKQFATAFYADPYAGKVVVALVPMASDKTRAWWKRVDNGQVVGGQARALGVARAVNYAKAHRSFERVRMEGEG